MAALDHGRLIFSEHFTSARGHGPALFGVLERALKSLDPCTQVVVGLGPGSYSGVRIAIAAAIGLELALDSAVVGIPSIAAIDTVEKSYLVTGDARRAQFFLARIDDGLVTQGPSLLPLSDLPAQLDGSLPIFSSAPVPGLPGIHLGHPSAERLARLVLRNHGITATSALEPIYLRAPHITQPRAV